MNLLKYLMVFLLFTFFNFELYSKGCAGSYTLKGTIFTDKNTPASNAEIEVLFGDTTFMITTNTIGEYELKIPWILPCLAHSPRIRKRQFNNQYNPKKILFHYNRKAFLLKNKWRKYAKCSFDKIEDSVEKHIDLKSGKRYNRMFPYF